VLSLYDNSKNFKIIIINKNSIKNMKKIIVIALAFCVLGTSFLVMNPSPTQGKTKPYYSGEAVNFNGKIFIGSTNSGKFELFALEGGKIVRKTAVASPANENKEFYDLLFSKEGGKLFAYLTNGRYLYKYDITNPIVPIVAMKIKDNSADWTSAVEKVDGNLITVTNRGVRIWNSKYQVVDSINTIKDKNFGTASFSKNNIAIANKDKVTIYSAVTRQKVAEYTLALNDDRAKRNIVSNADGNLTYVVDDKSLKAINAAGEVQKEFKHISNTGYDVSSSIINPDYIYFSDGLGIVKMDKNTFKPVSWAYTTRNTPVGSWAMGLDTVNDGTGEKVVVFNGSNILVVDQNMKEVAYYESVEEDTRPIENLFLNIDKNRGAAGTQVSVVGGGFGLGEELTIYFSGIKQATVKADESGRFSAVITVPSVLPGGADIKVTGKSTKKTYSTAFKIE
jgi:hypothetical protein